MASIHREGWDERASVAWVPPRYHARPRGSTRVVGPPPVPGPGARNFSAKWRAGEVRRSRRGSTVLWYGHVAGLAVPSCPRHCNALELERHRLGRPGTARRQFSAGSCRRESPDPCRHTCRPRSGRELGKRRSCRRDERSCVDPVAAARVLRRVRADGSGSPRRFARRFARGIGRRTAPR